MKLTTLLAIAMSLPVMPTAQASDGRSASGSIESLRRDDNRRGPDRGGDNHRDRDKDRGRGDNNRGRDYDRDHRRDRDRHQPPRREVQPPRRPAPPPIRPPHRPAPPPYYPPPARPLPPPPPANPGYPGNPGHSFELRAPIHQVVYGYRNYDLNQMFNLYQYRGYRLLEVAVVARQSRGNYGGLELLVNNFRDASATVTYGHNILYRLPAWGHRVIGQDAGYLNLVAQDVVVTEIILRLARY